MQRSRRNSFFSIEFAVRAAFLAPQCLLSIALNVHIERADGHASRDSRRRAVRRWPDRDDFRDYVLRDPDASFPIRCKEAEGCSGQASKRQAALSCSARPDTGRGEAIVTLPFAYPTGRALGFDSLTLAHRNAGHKSASPSGRIVVGRRTRSPLWRSRSRSSRQSTRR